MDRAWSCYGGPGLRPPILLERPSHTLGTTAAPDDQCAVAPSVHTAIQSVSEDGLRRAPDFAHLSRLPGRKFRRRAGSSAPSEDNVQVFPVWAPMLPTEWARPIPVVLPGSGIHAS